MNLIIIHGPPGVGKLTTARSLESSTGYIVLHNHLTFNVSRALFEIGDPRHIELHRELRLTMIKHAAKSDRSGLILTLAYFEPESVDVIREIKSICRTYGVALHSVFLHCDDDELHRRVVLPDRTENGKLDSSHKLGLLLKERRYVPIPDVDTFVIDNTNLESEKTSTLIADRYIG